MIKILYIIDKMKPAGAQKHLAEVVSGLDKAVFEPKLITLKELGVKRIYGWSGIVGLAKLIRFIRKEKFDIVQTYLFSENILGVIAAKLAGVKIVITGRRDTGMLCQGGFQHILAYRITNLFVAKIICVSEAVKRVVLEKERVDQDKVEVIYNGVDVSKFVHRPLSIVHRRSLGIEDNDLVVGMIANFSWIKGHEVLLKAAPDIIKAFPNVKFILIGDGPLLESYKLQAISYKLKDQFIFLGKREDIPELLSITDVSLNLSYSEGMSNTILESMASGVPVVATAVDGNLETVNKDTGILVRAKDPLVTAQAIVKLLKDEALRKKLGNNARKIVEEKFDSRIMIKKMEELYKKLLFRPSSIVYSPSSIVSFIFSQFPAYDETFILREMSQLQATGLKFQIYSLKTPKDKIIHDEAKDLAKTTKYMPFVSLKLILINFFFLLRHPLRYLSSFFLVFFGNLKSFNFLIRTLVLWFKAVGFAWVARKDCITHVHGQWATYPATVALIIARLNKIPFSFTGHAHDIYLDTTMLAEKLNQASFVTTCTGDNKRYLLSISKGEGRKSKIEVNRTSNLEPLTSDYSDKIIINYHGVDLRRFAPIQVTSHQSPVTRKFKILSVGSLLECKGFEYLIDACKILKEEGIEFECTIAGGGRLEHNLKCQISNLKLDNEVKLTGYITQDKLIPIYKQADVFVLAMVPEIHWGIPNVLLEAMAAGVPVVCTMLPSIPELVEDGKTGFIIPAKDSTAIALAVEKLYKDKELRERIVVSGRKVVEEKFDVVKNSLMLKRLFEDNRYK